MDDVIAGCVGGFVSTVSQLVSDVVTSAVCGSWQFSSWETYVGAFAGGVIGGVLTLYAGPVAGAGVGAGASTFIGQSLENLTGREKRSIGQLAANSIFDGAIGALVCKALPIKETGITSGRNSMQAVFKSGLTKLANCTARKMSAKVIAKGVISGVVSDIGRAAAMGFKQALFIR